MHKLKERYTKDTIVGEVDSKTQKVALYDRRRIARYQRNMLYLSGNQRLGFDVPDSTFFVSHFSGLGNVRKPVINKLINGYIISRSKFTRSMPGFNIPPSSQDKNDTDAAEIATGIMGYLHNYLREEEKNHEHWGWKLALGSVCHERYYENETENYEEDYDEEEIYEKKNRDIDGHVCIDCGAEFMGDETDKSRCPSCGSDNIEPNIMNEEYEEGTGEFKQIPRGNMVYKVRPPQDIIVPVTATSLETTPWLIVREYQYVDDIHDKYGKKADMVTAGSKADIRYDLTASTMNRIMSDAFGYGGIPLVTANTEHHEEMTVYKRYFERPSKMYPKGFYAVMANDVVLEMKEELPHKIQEMFTMHHFVKFPGHFWGFGLPDIAICHQDRLNSIAQKIQINETFNIFPKIWAVKGSNVVGHDGNTDTVAEYEHTQGEPQPFVMSGKGLPNDIYHEQVLAESRLDQAMFNPKVQQGEAPQGVEAGVALKLLKEEADVSLFDISGRFESNMEKEWKFTLKTFAKNTTEERKLKILGKNKRLKIQNFMGSDIENCMDICVKKGSSFPRSLAGQQEMLLAIADRGYLGQILNDPRKLDTFLGYFGIKDNFIDENNVDVEQAKHENFLILEKNEFEFEMGQQMNQETGQNEMKVMKVRFPVNEGKNILFDPRTGTPTSKFSTITIYENYMLHYMIHSDEMKMPYYDELDKKVQAFMQFHLNETMMAMQEQMMQQQAQAQAQQGQQKQQLKQEQPK